MQANRSARSPRPLSVCSFTFADGRQCRLPRRTGHPYLCLFHAKKEAQILSGEQAGQDIARFLTGNYISACDFAKSLARLFSAVAQGHIKPKTAATLAYLGQTLVQTLKLAQHEYINAFGTPTWRQTIASSFPPPPAASPSRSPSPRPIPPLTPGTPISGSARPATPERPTPPPAPQPQQFTPSPTPPPAPAKCSGGSLDPSPDPSPNPQPTPPSQSSPSPTTTQPPLQPTASPGTPISRLATPTPPPAPTPPPPQPNRRPDDDHYGITINGTKIIGRLRDF
jgi:hypothetical protein